MSSCSVRETGQERDRATDQERKKSQSTNKWTSARMILLFADGTFPIHKHAHAFSCLASFRFEANGKSLFLYFRFIHLSGIHFHFCFWNNTFSVIYFLFPPHLSHYFVAASAVVYVGCCCLLPQFFYVVFCAVYHTTCLCFVSIRVDFFLHIQLLDVYFLCFIFVIT